MQVVQSRRSGAKDFRRTMIFGEESTLAELRSKDQKTNKQRK